MRRWLLIIGVIAGAVAGILYFANLGPFSPAEDGGPTAVAAPPPTETPAPEPTPTPTPVTATPTLEPSPPPSPSPSAARIFLVRTAGGV